ncbi:hypothetical protein [Kribbella speibonae]|uniref:Uncharacterized protein n=1 Tax=Kribbella speibonae TaxID=1572660 RepID=A0A4R0INY0_9ACTN|nr:hypothetical protein [Kribbella speibonae]TCC25170.1 hypothetical protein E0H58_13425 [Kribbella speibonae]TCC32988.1 hypothetical protein E0H92_33030 [Kribbella speibonae]
MPGNCAVLLVRWMIVGELPPPEVIGAVIALVGLAVSIVGLLISWRGQLKKVLRYELGSTTSLGLTDKLSLVYDGTPLSKAQTVTVSVISDGRHSIRSTDFDGGPIEFDLSPATIVELLEATSEPPSYAAPTASFDGSKLRVGPGALGRHQRVDYLLIVDGDPALAIQAPLPDVEIGAPTVSRLWQMINKIFLGHRPRAYVIAGAATAYVAWFGYFFYLNPDVRGEDVSVYTSVGPAADEGTWLIQVPVGALPRVPAVRGDNCSKALERAVIAGAGLPVTSTSLRISIGSAGYRTKVSVGGARLIVDERRPLVAGARLKCPGRVEVRAPEDTDTLMVNLDDQTTRFIPARNPENYQSYHMLNVSAVAENCYCKWHLELDIKSGDSMKAVVVDASARLVGESRADASSIVPFEVVGAGPGKSYTYVAGQWKEDGLVGR